MKKQKNCKLSYCSPKMEFVKFVCAPVLNNVSANGITYGGVDDEGIYGD